MRKFALVVAVLLAIVGTTEARGRRSGGCGGTVNCGRQGGCGVVVSGTFSGHTQVFQPMTAQWQQPAQHFHQQQLQVQPALVGCVSGSCGQFSFRR